MNIFYGFNLINILRHVEAVLHCWVHLYTLERVGVHLNSTSVGMFEQKKNCPKKFIAFVKRRNENWCNMLSFS